MRLPHFVAASHLEFKRQVAASQSQLQPPAQATSVHQTCPLLLALQQQQQQMLLQQQTATGTATGHATVAGTSSVWSTDALQSDSR